MFYNIDSSPICRSEITTQSALKNIDSFLEKAVDVFFNDEAKKARKELLSTALPTASSAASASAATSPTPSTSAAAAQPSVAETMPPRLFLRRPFGRLAMLPDLWGRDPTVVVIDD